MDAIIIFGTIPTLWPLTRSFSGKRSGSDEFGPYQNATRASDHPNGTEAYRLSDRKKSRKTGPATRALEELDDMVTVRTVTDGD